MSASDWKHIISLPEAHSLLSDQDARVIALKRTAEKFQLQRKTLLAVCEALLAGVESGSVTVDDEDLETELRNAIASARGGK